MTGNKVSASARVGVMLDVQQVFVQTEHQLYVLQHELQLLADLAGSGPADTYGHLISLESVSVVLGSYAERLANLRALVLAAHESNDSNRGDKV